MALTRLGLNQSINLASNVTGTLAAGNGGTGATSFAPGKVLQVVSSNNSYGMTTSSTSLIDAESSSGVTWEPTITPSSSSSKILFISTVYLTVAANAESEGRGTMEVFEKIGSGSYSQIIDNYEGYGFYDYGSQGSWTAKVIANTKLRTTNTTDAVKYKFQFRVHNGATSAYFNRDTRESNCVLMEIAG